MKPHMGKGLSSASSEYSTGYGLIKSSWKTGASTTFEIQIPVNTRATIYLPTASADKIKESGKPLSALKEINVKSAEGNEVKLEMGSGSYVFEVR